MIHRLLRRIGVPAAFLWRFGRDHEIEFWDEYLRTGGGQWPEEFRQRMDPERELEAEIVALLAPSAGNEIALLDVGSGPLTALGPRCAGRSVRIVATDPLADQYAKLMQRHGVRPPVMPVRIQAEEIAKQLPADHFDLAHARNSLDHCRDPIGALEQMLQVLRPGGAMLLRHYRNEGETANYSGFHQWNISCENGRLLFWNPSRRCDVGELLAGRATVECEERPGNWVIARVRKRGEWIRTRP
jgi:SAM-dependent methyltransferase